MKTAMGMEKAKVWISGNLGTKMATRLFRGLALGALLVAATGLYFSINQGEAGSTLVSEQPQCYSELSMDCRHDLLSSFFGEQVEVYPEFDMVGRYGPLSFEIPEDPAPILGRPLSSEQMERLEVYEMMGVPWQIDDQGRVVVVEVRRTLPVDYSLVDWEEMTAADVGGKPLSSKQLELVYDLEMMGFPWRIDGQGKVVVVEAPQASVAPSPAYYEALAGADISYPDPWS